MNSTLDRAPNGENSEKRVLLVLSDVHYDEDKLLLAIGKHPEIDTVLFLGDGYRLFDDVSLRYPRVGFIGVRGNCDYDASEAPYSKVFSVYGLNIYLCHGHLMAVKQGLEALCVTASGHNCSLALFGHTHLPFLGEKETKNGKMTLLNPGSIGSPPIGKLPSYALVTVFPDGKFTAELKTL